MRYAIFIVFPQIQNIIILSSLSHHLSLSQSLKDREESVERVVAFRVETVKKKFESDMKSLGDQLDDAKRGLVMAEANYVQVNCGLMIIARGHLRVHESSSL